MARALTLGAMASLAPDVARSQGAGVDTASARAALGSFQEACRADSGKLWGKSLCGRLVLVDRATRWAAANHPDPAGEFRRDGEIWIGTLPADLGLANTALQWRGQDWASVLLPLPKDEFGLVTLLVHESYHRIQDSLGLGGTDALNPHLDSRDGRLWLRLELRALEYALTTDGAASRAHAAAAMRFRSERQRLIPGADSVEDALELREGLAEYTGQRVASQRSNLGALRTVLAMQEVERNATLVRSFAYATGPALGMLLDRFDPGWRTRIARSRSMGAMLSAASGVRGASADGTDVAATARPYGYSSIAAQEDQRASDRAAKLAAYRARLVEGPVLTLRQDRLTRAFNPNTLTPLDSSGTVYPTGTFGAEWGKLEVSEGGALVSPDYRTVRVRAPAAAPGAGSRSVAGDGWTLTLEEGWAVRAVGRAGDFEVVEVP